MEYYLGILIPFHLIRQHVQRTNIYIVRQGKSSVPGHEVLAEAEMGSAG